MKQLPRGISYVPAIAATLFSGILAAQTATGTSTTSCTQSGTTLTCATTTTIQLPSSDALTPGSGLSTFTVASGTQGPTPPASCTISPGNSTVAVGSTPTLTVSCASPGSGTVYYVWSKDGINVSAGVAPTYTLTPANTGVAGASTYSVTVGNSIGSTVAATNVTVQASTVTPPSACSISPAGVSVTPGSTPTFTVTCGGGAVATYAWTRNGVAVGVNASTYTAAASETATAGAFIYAVTASNSAGPATASTTLTVTPGTPSAQNFCPGNQAANATLNAASTYARLDSTSLIGTNSHYVVRLDVPAIGASTVGRQPVLFSNIEAPSSQRSFRDISISKNLCDYTAAANTFVIAAQSAGGAKEITVDDLRAGYPNLTPGTWYINVKNTTGACPANQYCNVALEWSNY